MILLIAFIISGFFLVRSALIVIGLYKTPILKSFEKYGDGEVLYLPVVNAILSILTFLGVLVVWVTDIRVPANFKGSFVSFFYLMWGAIAIYFAYNWLTDFAQKHPRWFIVYPRWYNDLRDRTSRAERRRLAYMWLYLPFKTRLIYNSSDVAFQVWTDLVLLSTIRPDDDGVLGPGVHEDPV